jgi:hypothetical protein
MRSAVFRKFDIEVELEVFHDGASVIQLREGSRVIRRYELDSSDLIETHWGRWIAELQHQGWSRVERE